ncbi:Mif2/CENP-C like-domain-containing protein [Mycena maculata]|uniref:CENP-C homolog n=1 Tax=Mycena maculata TaxID=230809 RepID=A0AAD7JSH8_9AGAR|nr:Mif2/CENP-C like-domain-containing protein [Mycena maculata]
MAHTPNKPSKPHIPYRGDDPSVGKKTGIKVARVERNADGYEPFERILHQANSRPPPRLKKKSIPREDSDDEEEDEEESMDIDSPVQYATTPRANTSARPVSRGDASGFNAVPSPRAHKSGGRAGPSRLTSRELLEQDEGEDQDGGMYDLSQVDDFGDDYDDEEEPEPPIRGKGTPAPGDMRKGKGRPLEPVDEEEEEEITRGMEQAELDASDDGDQDQQEEERPKKKARATPAPKSRNRKENREVPEGVRRSKRVPIPPLDYWRGEKYVYAPRVAGQKRQVPTIAEIVRIPKEPTPVPPRRGASKRKRARSESKSVVVREREVVVEVDAGNPEAGWDDDTRPDADVLDYSSGEPVTRRVAFTARMFKPAPVAGGQWFFEKIFGDGDFMAAGQLVIPAQGRKPAKGTKDNTYIFYVVEGAVNVVVCETSLVLATGAMFMVPRGNSYFIENIAERDAKLFFTQARKISDDEESAETGEGNSVGPARRGVSVAMAGSSKGEARSGSAGSAR